MNWTAVLHVAATAIAGAGILLFESPVTIGLLVVAGVLFIGGIVIARRDDGSEPRSDTPE
jgi:hypothetical protein